MLCVERERQRRTCRGGSRRRAGQVTRAKDSFSSPPSSPRQPHPASCRGSLNHLPIHPSWHSPAQNLFLGRSLRQAGGSEAVSGVLSLGCVRTQATLPRWRPQRQHSWAVASSPRPGQPCQREGEVQRERELCQQSHRWGLPIPSVAPTASQLIGATRWRRWPSKPTGRAPRGCRCS